MSTQPNDLIILSYGADVAEHERRALETSLSGWDWSLRRGFAEQSRSGTAVIILACLTLVGTGFFQRFGEVAADRMIAVVGAVWRWMRDRAGSHPASGSCEGKSSEVVDIVDRESGLTIRLTGAEPDLAFDMLSALLQHRSEAFDLPLMWGEGEWSQEEDRD